ncbi:MAG TPA: ABC transporter permease [Candidatus Saccharimonadia bacterium]|jgi:ABC-type transport system involved in multi-copper enzyme maturation permease subunit
MLLGLKSEFRKLLTIRSTYGIVAAALLIGAFVAIDSVHIDSKAALQAPDLLANASTNTIVFIGFLLAFPGLLLMGNEYRYNTIMYTLTSSNSRLKTLLAKVITVSVFAVVTSLVASLLAPLCMILGAHLLGVGIGHQVFNYWSIIWRCAFTGWGYSIYGLILAIILRSQIGSIVTFLLVPLVGENLLMGLLRYDGKYLPFTALQSVARPAGLGSPTTSGHEAVVVLAYTAVGLIVSTILFVSRDAN